jgi:long-chain acyl-CoA synthetase
MDAAVYGVPEKVLGEEVVCSVQLKPSHKNITAEDIVAHCRKNMAAFKVPIYVDVRHEPLPRNGGWIAWVEIDA